MAAASAPICGMVNATGRVPNDLMLIGEAPGYEEVMAGRPFVGKAGQQLWADMQRICGITREDFYVTNVIKEGLPNNRDPKPAEIAAALPEVLGELARVRPRVVVTAGAFATHVFLDRPMSDLHGLPHVVDLAGDTYTIMPIYHPAAGLHNKGFLSAFSYDLQQLKLLLEGKLDVRRVAL